MTISEVIDILREVQEDEDTPKNVRKKVCAICEKLSLENSSVEISKALHEIETLSSDYNLPSHLRTQLFSVVSLLEIA